MTTSVLPTSEAQWMVTIVDALDLTGWSWIHFRPARGKDGKWTTPTQGNSSKGFPDLVCVRQPRVLWIEVKTNHRRATPDQNEWIGHLRASGQEAHIMHFPLLKLFEPVKTSEARIVQAGDLDWRERRLQPSDIQLILGLE